MAFSGGFTNSDIVLHKFVCTLCDKVWKINVLVNMPILVDEDGTPMDVSPYCLCGGNLSPMLDYEIQTSSGQTLRGLRPIESAGFN